MGTRITPNNALSLDETAEALRAKLLQHVIRCKRRSLISSGMVEPVDVTYSHERHFIGKSYMWFISMKDGAGEQYSVSINSMFTAGELLLIFRNAFGRFGVPLDHAQAQAFYDKPNAGVGVKVHDFTPGKTVVVTEGLPVFVRPKGDLTASVWVNAELRIESLGSGDDRNLGIRCNVDTLSPQTGYRIRLPDAWGNRSLGGDASVEKKLTFFVSVLSPGNYTYLPIARLVAHDPVTRAHTFVLDDSVKVDLLANASHRFGLDDSVEVFA